MNCGPDGWHTRIPRAFLHVGTEYDTIMSTSDEETGLLRTVTPLSGTHGDAQMNFIGWLMFALMVVVLLPLVPVYVVVWIVARLMGR